MTLLIRVVMITVVVPLLCLPVAGLSAVAAFTNHLWLDVLTIFIAVVYAGGYYWISLKFSAAILGINREKILHLFRLPEG